MQTENWYVAYTYPRCEKKVEKRVKEMGIDCYLPLKTVFRKWSDRVKKVEIPLFMNYIFVRSQPHEIFRVKEIDGLANFIYFGNEPATVKPKEIEWIKKMMYNGSEVEVATDSFKRGQRVTVQKGPFMGLEGVLLEEYGKHRFIVEFKGIEQKLAVNIPVHYLA
ncbi:MAG: transcriptional antiterminator [Saprospiraceae bacterium]|nr:MAG: transcriptional antiterminator [Saprospiraceae bacterium]